MSSLKEFTSALVTRWIGPTGTVQVAKTQPAGVEWVSFPAEDATAADGWPRLRVYLLNGSKALFRLAAPEEVLVPDAGPLWICEMMHLRHPQWVPRELRQTPDVQRQEPPEPEVAKPAECAGLAGQGALW